MKVRYQFVAGENSEVEAPDAVGAAISEIEHKERLRNRVETRRHSSIDALWENGVQFACDANTEDETIQRLNLDMLREALTQLLPRQRELIHLVYFEDESCASIARKWNTDESSVRECLRRAEKRLAKSLHK